MPNSTEVDQTFSPEVDQIMGYIPSKIVRYGIILIFLTLSFLLICSYFFKYPEIVSTTIILSTVNSPAPLISKTTGRIDSWFASDNQIVERGAPIALLQSTARYEDIMAVKVIADSFRVNQKVNIQDLIFPESVVLGEVQDAYLNFYKAFTDLKYFLEQNSIIHEINTEQQLIKLNKEQYEINLKLRIIKVQKLNITRKSFAQDSLLFQLNKFGIPQREFDASIQSLLQEKENLLAFDATLKNLETSIVQMQSHITELKLNHNEKLNEYLRLAHDGKEQLENKISLWSEDYLLVSPIKGKVTFTNFWSSNQVITSGQRLATIIPLEETFIVGRAYVPSSGLGKVEVGQLVNIKLAGFPFMRYGLLKGTIKSISLVPEEKGYVAEITLPNGMISNYSETLKFVHEMDGIAEIVTKDRRLISRLLNY